MAQRPAGSALLRLGTSDFHPTLPIVPSLNFGVAPVGGEDLQKRVEKVLATPKDLAARARHLTE